MPHHVYLYRAERERARYVGYGELVSRAQCASSEATAAETAFAGPGFRRIDRMKCHEAGEV